MLGIVYCIMSGISNTNCILGLFYAWTTLYINRKEFGINRMLLHIWNCEVSELNGTGNYTVIDIPCAVWSTDPLVTSVVAYVKNVFINVVIKYIMTIWATTDFYI